MSDALPRYVFHIRIVSRQDDSYYVTRWDLATPMQVIGSTQQEAIEEAKRVKGDAGRHRYWEVTVDRITSVEVA